MEQEIVSSENYYNANDRNICNSEDIDIVQRLKVRVKTVGGLPLLICFQHKMNYQTFLCNENRNNVVNRLCSIKSFNSLYLGNTLQ